MIYLDNAATSYPKPEEVYQAHDRYLRQAANPGRGTHSLTLASARAIFEVRLALADFLGIRQPERVIFTGGCTQSINMALKGFPFKEGDVVVTSALEHNAVMRPLTQLKQLKGIKIYPLPYTCPGVVSLSDLVSALKNPKVRLCVLCQASNVTGELVDLAAVAEICHKRKVPLMVDAAQSAGFSEGRVEELGISIWCASGHKGLMGPPGVGILYVAPDLDLEPLIAGGTGSRSEQFEMPDCYPDRLEAGTLAGPAIAGLGAGIGFIRGVGLDAIRDHETKLAEQFLSWAAARAGIKIYGPGAGEKRTATVSFQLSCMTPDTVSDRLDKDFGIALRSGLHCAAAAHKVLGTASTGLVRASFGYFNTKEDTEALCRALDSLLN